MKYSKSLAFILLIALPLPTTAFANEVFVQQLSPENRSGAVAQPAQSGGAFVPQMPPGAKPRPRTPVVARPVMVEEDFIDAQQAPGDKVDTATANVPAAKDPAITPYESGVRPSLPSITTGTTVILVSPELNKALPSVGAGAVLL